MTKETYWQQQNYWKLGPNFGLTIKDQQVGYDGTDIYSFYAVTDNKDTNVFGLSNANGLFKLYNDRSIEIIAGQNNAGGGVDIVIAGKNGDITITAERNGNVRIRAKNVIIDADENINLSAGRNVNIKAGSRFVVQTTQADCIAKTGSLAPQGTSSGERVFPQGSPAGDDVIENAFYAGNTNKFIG
jgi:hypothetical protein